MFYSQTFLARKGPLGTVWRAAHQLRVKKSQYTSTDIPSTVDRIMFPEVPIALRMSAFLLLGIVRIYSKKVEFLSDDCNAALAWLRKAFASIELTLPEEARQAPFQSITLPETFDLDALNLDDGNRSDGNQDNHLRRIEDITLADQIPTGRDLYIAISFDEDIMVDSTIPNEVSDFGIRPMETDFQLPSPVSRNVAFEDSTPANATDAVINDHTATQKLPEFQDVSPPDQSEFRRVTRSVAHSVDKSPQSVPEIEVLRDAPPETSSVELPLLSPPSNTIAEPLGPRDQTSSHKSMLSPIMEDTLALSMPRRSLRLTPASLREDSTMTGLSPHQSALRLEVSPPELALRSTPPNQQRKPRPRKRKQFFDDSTVLTNKFMKKSLKDHSDLVRRRRNIPCSSLDRWKLANTLRKEQIFHQPSITGLCSDLRNMFDKDYIFAKPHLISPEEESSRQTNPSPPRNETVVQPFPSPTLASPRTEHSPRPAPVSTPDHRQDVGDNNEAATLPEIERLRHVVDDNESVTLPDAFPSWPTPPRRDDPNPMWSKNFGSPVVPSMEASTSGGGFSSFNDPASSRACDFEFEMATIPEEERRDLENSDLPNITTLMNTTEPEDLYFLEADNSPAGSPATQRVDSLSVRTRAVARYVQSLTPTKSVPEDTSQNLSLNKILQGKTRKLCARMFYETLVLKSYSMIDVRQDEPYGDIILQPTPKLSKAQI